MTSAPVLQAAIDIRADRLTVWHLVSDLVRMPQWSPQTWKVWVRGGQVKRGAKTINLNKRGRLVWPTTSEVVSFEPPERLAFRVPVNKTTWLFELESSQTGTRLTQTRTAPYGLSGPTRLLMRVGAGSVSAFEDELLAGMNETLGAIRDAAERQEA